MDRLSVLRALAAAGALLFAPGAALAGDEFEDGFKDELGRLAAHEAVRVGRGVLSEGLVTGGPGYYVEQYPVYGRGYYYDDCDRGYWYPNYGGWYYAPRPYYRPYWGRPHWGGSHGHGHGHGWGHRGHNGGHGHGHHGGGGWGHGGGGGRGQHGHHR